MANFTLTFKIYRGDDLVRTDTLEQDVVKIGKLSTSHVRLEDETVSRMHAVVEVSGEDVNVIDLGSTRGTLLNGEKINKAKLSDGDELRLGDTRVVVGIERKAAEQPLAATMIGAPAPVAPRAAAAPPVAVAPPMGMAPPPPRPLTPAPAPMVYAAPAMGAAAPSAVALDLDDRNAAHAIEVAALFHDTVVDVAHLLNPKQGTVSGLTYGKLVIAAVLVLGGLGLTVAGQVGVASFCLVAGVAVGVLALLRLYSEKTPPHYFIGEDPAANFHVSATNLPTALFPLVHSSGSDYSLRFTSAMGGDVTLPAGSVSISRTWPSAPKHIRRMVPWNGPSPRARVASSTTATTPSWSIRSTAPSPSACTSPRPTTGMTRCGTAFRSARTCSSSS